MLSQDSNTPQVFNYASQKIQLFSLLFLHARDRSDTIPLFVPQSFDKLVSHYDCSHQKNPQQFSQTRVQPCSQARSSLQYTSVPANDYVRAKLKRIETWTCEVYIKEKRFVCAHSDYRYRHHDRTDDKTKKMEHPFVLDPKELKYATRFLNCHSSAHGF